MDVMEEVVQKLVVLNYPRASVPPQSLLYAGLERYTLLEWLFFKLLGDKSPFADAEPGPVLDAEVDLDLEGRGERGAGAEQEWGKIQYLAQIAKFLGLTPGLDTEAIQGKGSYENRAEGLQALVELVEASLFADNSEWSGDDQLAKDVQLLDGIAERQVQVFSDDCKLFPADVVTAATLSASPPQLPHLQAKLAELTSQAAELEQALTLAGSRNYDSSEEQGAGQAEAEGELRRQLHNFVDTAKAFDAIYAKEIRPWTHSMEVPQLHGLGAAAKHVVESYKNLLRLLRNLKGHREAHAAMADAEAEDEPGSSSLARLVADCEDALVGFNHGLNVLSASHTRATPFTAL